MTDSSAISFLGIQLPVIAALLPSLVLNKLAVTQALDRRSGAVFYLDVKYGDNKGGISANSTMMSATTGHNTSVAGREYASVRVANETLAVNATSGTFAYTPIVLGSVVLTNGTETFTDAAVPGTLVSSLSGGNTGIVTAAGGWMVSGWTGTGIETATYKYDWQTYSGSTTNQASVPEVSKIASHNQEWLYN